MRLTPEKYALALLEKHGGDIDKALDDIVATEHVFSYARVSPIDHAETQRIWNKALDTSTFGRSVQEQESEMMVRSLKNFDPHAFEIDELVELLAFAGLMTTTYSDLDIMLPKWLDDAQRRLRNELKARAEEQLRYELEQERRRLDNLKTSEERREETKARIAQLDAKLAG